MEVIVPSIGSLLKEASYGSDSSFHWFFVEGSDSC